MDTVVRVENLALGPFKKLNIEIPLNSFTFITGSNNSGKSLLLKVMSGVINTKNVTYNKEIIKSDNDIGFIFNLSFNFLYFLWRSKYNI